MAVTMRRRPRWTTSCKGSKKAERYAANAAPLRDRRQPAKARAAEPSAIIAQVEGSGMPAMAAGAAAKSKAALRAALDQSLHMTFVSLFAIALLVAATAAMVPRVVFAAKRAMAE
jgi:hypothetical protein